MQKRELNDISQRPGDHQAPFFPLSRYWMRFGLYQQFNRAFFGARGTKFEC